MSTPHWGPDFAALDPGGALPAHPDPIRAG
jgi:hypothetical protein